MASVAGHTDPMSDARTVRGSEPEAVEAGAKRALRGGKGPRVRIQRDQAEIPAVKDDTGEKVAQLFEGFLEQCVLSLFGDRVRTTGDGA